MKIAWTRGELETLLRKVIEEWRVAEERARQSGGDIPHRLAISYHHGQANLLKGMLGEQAYPYWPGQQAISRAPNPATLGDLVADVEKEAPIDTTGGS